MRGCEYSRGPRAAVWSLRSCLMSRSTASSFTEQRGTAKTTEDIQRKGRGGKTKPQHDLPNQSITCPKLKSHEVRLAAPVCSTAQSLRIVDQKCHQSDSVCMVVKPGKRLPKLVLNNYNKKVLNTNTLKQVKMRNKRRKWPQTLLLLLNRLALMLRGSTFSIKISWQFNHKKAACG